MVEILVSVALVVILLVGVNQVFRMTGETIAGGTMLSQQTRDLRAAQAVLGRDMSMASADGPLIWLSCRSQKGFFSDSDKFSDPNGDELDVDLNGNGTEGEPSVPGEAFNFTSINHRVHRHDVLAFCARGLFRRQMGEGGNFVGTGTSAEAYIHYGPARLPSDTNKDGTRAFFNFGQTTAIGLDTNVNNVYASQVMYTRVCLLLRDPSQLAGQTYIKRWQSGDPTSYGGVALSAEETALSPLSMRSLNSAGSAVLQESRCDVAGASLSALKGYIATAMAATPSWWQPLLYESASREARFHCNPWISKPLIATGMAEASTQFLTNVNQFIVEYAGDYMTQSPDGSVTALAPDGQVDFCIDTTQNPSGVRRIRWYGRPRDVNGDGTVLGGGNPTAPANWSTDPQVRMNRMKAMVDVVPLTDYRNCFAGANGQAASFEKELPHAGVGPDQYSIEQNPYTCVFTNPNDMPWMIRVIIQISDPSERLRGGQWAEMVYNLR